MVLIETLWNVNRGQVIATPVENIVLIETLWNVNELVKHDICCTTLRINRNIVECKFATTSFNNSIVFCINRNIVECKFQCFVNSCSFIVRINRNIVECK